MYVLLYNGPVTDGVNKQRELTDVIAQFFLYKFVWVNLIKYIVPRWYSVA